MELDGPLPSTLGTVLAIVHPRVGAQWADADDDIREMVLHARYYGGLAMIFAGVVIDRWMWGGHRRSL